MIEDKSESGVIGSTLVSKTNSSESLSDSRAKKRELLCKCGRTYLIECSDYLFEKKRYRKHCSRSCANSRVQTEEINKKRSSTVTEGYKSGRILSTLGKKKRLTEKRILYLSKTRNLRAERVKRNCLYCGKEVEIKLSYSDRFKFCSGTCRNKVNNSKIRGSRSKAEIYLEKKIRENFPSLDFRCNDRQVLGGNLELDFYLPDLKLGIELNGIHHLVDVHGKGSLAKRLDSDKRKLEKASSKGIQLLVLEDKVSSKKSIEENSNKALEYINVRVAQ